MLIPMIFGNVYLECVCFYSEQGATMPHGHSLQRGATLSWMKTGVLWI
ncbi:MAG: hypothetical protein HND53_10640 [Proteobacteria bacterium]|nr:hypothetical protein [Pseudomonadota bacterium]